VGLHLKLLHERNTEKRNVARKRTRPSVQEESGIIFETSGFWPRVCARALRAPVFLSSFPPQSGRCAPPPSSHCSFADPSGNNLGSKLCTCSTIRPNFFLVFPFFYSFWIFSFYYSLLFLLSFSILLILLFLFFSWVLFFVFLFFFSYILTCLLYYRHAYIHIRHYEGFFEGAKSYLIHLGSIYRCDHMSYFCLFYSFLFFSPIIFLFYFSVLYSSSSYSSSIFKLFVVLQTCILNIH
jgi:hypothetical protein